MLLLDRWIAGGETSAPVRASFFGGEGTRLKGANGSKVARGSDRQVVSERQRGIIGPGVRRRVNQLSACSVGDGPPRGKELRGKKQEEKERGGRGSFCGG